ncbi:MAG: PP2C family protein-serine/threonine phosphatase [Balneolaceae bacterium]
MLAALLSVLWVWYSGPGLHPLNGADATLGSDSAMQRATETLERYGFKQDDSVLDAYYTVHKGLADSLQRAGLLTRHHENPEFQQLYPLSGWQVDLYHTGQQPGRVQIPFSQSLTAAIQLRYNDAGEWLELRNSDRVRLAEVTGDPDPIGQDEAVAIAERILRVSAWPRERFTLQSVVMPPALSNEGITLYWQAVDTPDGFEAELVVRLGLFGELIALEANWLDLQRESIWALTLTRVLQGLLLVFFFFWVLSELYIRLRSRVVDVKTAIPITIAAGVVIPGTELLGWLRSMILYPGSLNWIDVMLPLVFAGVTGAFVSLGYFIVTVTGESVARQYMAGRVRTLDLLRTGPLLNRPLGRSILHGVLWSVILVAMVAIYLWIFPSASLGVTQVFTPRLLFASAPAGLLVSVLFSILFMQTIFLLLLGKLGNYSSGTLFTVVISALIFGLFTPLEFVFHPGRDEWILSALFGAVLGVLFARRDFLTPLIACTLAESMIHTSGGWIVPGSPDTHAFLLTLTIAGGLLLFGLVAIIRGKPSGVLPRFRPGYIEELAKERRIRNELQIARKVQQSFLPNSRPRFEGLDLAAVCLPAQETGGDYYDFLKLDENRIAVVIGDVSGKGVQAAFHMTFVKGMLHALCREDESSVSVMKRANELFFNHTGRGTFISMLYGIIDLKEGEFRFARAGHNPLLHYDRSKNELRPLVPDGLAIGLVRGELFDSNIREQVVSFNRDDLLILYTDGIVEAENRTRHSFGTDRLHRLVYFHQAGSSEEVVHRILHEVSTFTRGVEQHDDMTLIVVKRE